MTPLTPDIAIGWIGTGVMGRSMCGHLLGAGYTVHVHTRSRGRAAPLLERGAHWAESPAAAARASGGAVVTMVGFPEDVREVYFGAQGLLRELRPGGLAIDMTTTRPSLALEIARAAAERGAESLDAPV